MGYNIADISGAVSRAESDNQRANLSDLQMRQGEVSLQQGQENLKQSQFTQSQQGALRAAMGAAQGADGSFNEKAAIDVLRKSAPELIPKLQEQSRTQSSQITDDKKQKIVFLGKSASPIIRSNGQGYEQWKAEAERMFPGVKLPDTFDPKALQSFVDQSSALGPTTKLSEGEAEFDVNRNLVNIGPPGIKAATLSETMRHNRATEGSKAGELSSDQSDVNAPWRNIGDGKKRDEARMRFGAAADKRLESAQEETAKSNNVITSLDRFMQLNSKNETGARYAVPGAKTIAGTLSPEIGEMKSIVDMLTPMMRNGMPGAASDRDVAMFRGATVGLDKPKKANENIALGLKVANQNVIDKATFLSEYVSQYGHDRGSDVEWKKYLRENPIFDPLSPTGSYKINPRRKTYNEWKGVSGTEAQTTPSAPTTTTPSVLKYNPQTGGFN